MHYRVLVNVIVTLCTRIVHTVLYYRYIFTSTLVRRGIDCYVVICGVDFIGIVYSSIKDFLHTKLFVCVRSRTYRYFEMLC